MSTTTEKPPRKFPPPCWTQEEALALIEAYRERWYALRRGYLRTADWDAVADAVGHRCPDASPAKTSAQCRHKMEKLRQRYRAEKQRALSYPGRFFSSWFYFESMDAMENGSPSTVGSNQDAGDRIDSGNGSRVKSLIDHNLVQFSKNNKKIDGDSNPNLRFDREGLDPGGGIRVKVVSDRNLVPLGFRTKNSSPNFGSRVSNGYLSYLDNGSDEDGDGGGEFGGGFHVKTPIDGNFVPPGLGTKKFGNVNRNSIPKYDGGGSGVDVCAGFRMKTLIDQDPIPQGLRSRRYGKFDVKLNPNFDCENGAYDAVDADGEFWVKIPGDRKPVPPALRGKYSGKADRTSSPNVDPRVPNGFSPPPGSVFGKRNGGGGVKRERGAVAEMVSSIKLLGEGFVKMEKMKMEMAKEIEKMRMEMEMKRNELLLESQQQIVDAFVKGLFENSKKVKTTLVPES